jgi:phospholipid/cholesterol/gamma-HCH transport system substrate-binding protein
MKVSNEAKVGMMITLSLTIFIVMIALLSKVSIAQKGYTLRLYFGFLNGLRVGAPVKIAGGIKIGQVDSITQSAEKTEVNVWIDRKYNLIRTARFAIFTTGLIGEKYVNVFIPPTVDVDDFLSDGDKIYAVDPASFDQMMLTFQGFMQDQSGGEILANIFQNSKKFVENLNGIAYENRQDIRKSVLSAKTMFINLAAQTQTLMKQMNRFTGNMAILSEKNKEEFSIAVRNLSEVTKSLNKIIFRLEKGKGTLGKLLMEEDIYINLKDASISAKDLFRSLSSDPSKLFYRPRQQ